MRTEKIVAFTLLAASLVVIIPFNDHRSIMLNSMLVQISMGAFMVGVLALIGRKVQVFMACMIAGGLMSLTLPDFHQSQQQLAWNSDTLKVVHFNVLKLNHDHQTILKAVIKENPDILSFQEVTYEWDTALNNGLLAKYPYHINAPREGSFGISFYSRCPLTNTEVKNFEGIPYIKGTILKGNQRIAFITSHTIPPTNENFLALRNRLVRKIGQDVTETQTPKLVIGDMNAVPWDSAIRHLEKSSQLRDSRKSLNPTYPTWLVAARIPIDYIFYGGGLACKDFKVIGHSSSDHLGIAGEYVLPSILPSH